MRFDAQDRRAAPVCSVGRRARCRRLNSRRALRPNQRRTRARVGVVFLGWRWRSIASSVGMTIRSLTKKNSAGRPIARPPASSRHGPRQADRARAPPTARTAASPAVGRVARPRVGAVGDQRRRLHIGARVAAVSVEMGDDQHLAGVAGEDQHAEQESRRHDRGRGRSRRARPAAPPRRRASETPRSMTKVAANLNFFGAADASTAAGSSNRALFSSARMKSASSSREPPTRRSAAARFAGARMRRAGKFSCFARSVPAPVGADC